jgi:hypothetical protein
MTIGLHCISDPLYSSPESNCQTRRSLDTLFVLICRSEEYERYRLLLRPASFQNAPAQTRLQRSSGDRKKRRYLQAFIRVCPVACEYDAIPSWVVGRAPSVTHSSCTISRAYRLRCPLSENTRNH